MATPDDDTERAATLAENAHGDSVTAKRLTTTSTGMLGKDLFATDPLITYLGPDEQPHCYLYNDTKGVTRNGTTVGGGNDATYRSQCLVTDQRVLFFTDGSKGIALSYGAITGVETKEGRMKYRLTLTTAENEYTFYASNSIDSKEFDLCGKYIEDNAADAADSWDGKETTAVPGLSELWTGLGAEGPDADEALSVTPQGAYVTEERYAKVRGILDPEERVHFITRGSTVDVEGSSAGHSLFGDDRSRKSGTRGWVRAVITDKRVAIKIPQFLGTDERSVPYSSITSVDLDTGLINKRLTLQTPGQTYHIEAQDPNKEEVRQAVRFIRQQVEAANQPQVVQQQPAEDETDPLEQIEKLKELNDAGAITDAEFEEKKQHLLDQI
jgi:hypothetical protein